MIRRYHSPALASALALTLCCGLACGKEALYKVGKDPRLSTIQFGQNPGPNQAENVFRYEYDADGRLLTEYRSRTSYAGFNLRDDAPGNISNLTVTDYFYEGDRLVASELRFWTNQLDGCLPTDEGCYAVGTRTSYRDFAADGLPALRIDFDADARETRRCSYGYDAAGLLVVTRCVEPPRLIGGDSIVVTTRRFYDGRGNARQTITSNGPPPLLPISTISSYHPTLLNPVSLKGLPQYANPVSRNLSVETDGRLREGTAISDGDLVRAIVLDDTIVATYGYE